MALLFLDSFDHYTDGGDKYLSGGSAITATGRHGKGCTGANRLALVAGHSRILFGAAWKFGSTFQQFFELFDHTATIGTTSTQNDGSIQVAMFGGFDLHTPPDTVRLNQWHYIELDFTVVVERQNVGTVDELTRYGLNPCRVILDGGVVIDGSLDFAIWQNGAPSPYGWTHMDIFPNGYGTYDDLYVCDGSGPAPWNAPLGDVQIDVIRPNAAGAQTEWTPFGAATNFACVKDATPDDETTKVIAAAAGPADLYNLDDVNTNNGIIGAQLLVSARRTEEGFARLASLIRHAGVTTVLSTRDISPSFFYRNRDVFVTMPNGDPLTDVNLNALQAGFRREV